MRYSKNTILFIILLFSIVTLVMTGCGYQKTNVNDIFSQPIEEVDHFKLSKKRQGICQGNPQDQFNTIRMSEILHSPFEWRLLR